MKRPVLVTLCAAVTALAAAAGEPPAKEAEKKAGVRDLAAFHRRGQTFVTWREVPARPDAEYRVYRSARSFDGRVPDEKELVARLRSGSALLPDEGAGEGAGHGLKRKAIVDRSRGGMPLPRGTGLFVWTARGAGRFHYCVLAGLRGKPPEAGGVGGLNATSRPVDEAPAPPGAVQFCSTGPAGWYYLTYGDFREWSRERADALWGGSAWSFHVAAPRDPPRGRRLPVRVVLHGYRAQGVRYPQTPVAADLIYVSAQDWQNSFWWGWARSIPRAGPAAWPAARGPALPNSGPVEPYAARKLGRIIEWIAARPDNLAASPDPSRIYLYGHSVGGSGAINHVLAGEPGSGKVAGVVATMFPISWPRGCYWEKALRRVWGSRNAALKAAGLDASAYDAVTPLALARRAARKPGRFEPPLIEISLGTLDRFAPVDDLGKLCDALEAARIPYFAHWGRYGHESGRLSGAKNRAFELRLDEPLLAFASASCNSGRPTKDSTGYRNSALEWSSPANDFDEESRADDFLEARDGCAFSVRLVSGSPPEYLPNDAAARARVDITPRRTREFLPMPGAVFQWRAIDPNVAGPGDPPVLASGKVTTDARGLITLKGVPVLKEGMGTRVQVGSFTTAGAAARPRQLPKPSAPGPEGPDAADRLLDEIIEAK